MINSTSGIKLNSGVYLTDEISRYDGFLSPKECARILEELQTVFWRPSLTYTREDDKTYKHKVTPFRVSKTAHQKWFGSELNVILSRIERRLESIFGIRSAHLEPWQATKYPIGGKFDYHLDSGYWKDHPAGERILTFLIYLTTPRIGGGTHFRALDVYVEGYAGQLLVWKNLFCNGNPNYRMIHSSVPIEKGEKVTLVSWERQHKFWRGRD